MSSFHIKDIDKEIKQTIDRLKELEEVIKKLEEPEPWRPSEDFIGALSGLVRYYKHLVNMDKEAVQYLLIKELARELNGDWVPDWSTSQIKYRLYYLVEYKTWEYCSTYICKSSEPIFSEESKKKALKILNRGDVDELVKEICGE